MHNAKSETIVLIPIRSFDHGKTRLAPTLDIDDRRRLTMQMARRVVEAAGNLPVRVVTDDPGVVDWVEQQWIDDQRIEVMAVNEHGLNPSVTTAVARAAGAGFDRAIIAHADLPAADELSVVDRPGVCIAPDRGRDGSNVMCVPTAAGFVFSYGPDSFARHCAEAERLGLPLTVVDDESLAWDVDDPADLPTDWIV